MERGKIADLLLLSLEQKYNPEFRCYREVGIHSHPSFAPCGFPLSRRLDLVIMERQRKKGGEPFKQFGFEIKSCMADLKSDNKMHLYIDRVDRLSVVMWKHKDVEKILSFIPEQFGLIFVDLYHWGHGYIQPQFQTVRGWCNMDMTIEARFSLLYGMACANENGIKEYDKDRLKQLLAEKYSGESGKIKVENLNETELFRGD